MGDWLWFEIDFLVNIIVMEGILFSFNYFLLFFVFKEMDKKFC